jgi:16S rRNA (cytosine967-C5)-methyltransferase
MAVTHSARKVALEALLQSERPGDFLEHRLDSQPAFRALVDEDRRLCRELAFGVLRNRAALDWLIARRTDGRAQKPALQAILRLGVYQLFFLDRIPDHAAVNESVELARASGGRPQAGFVNALLRGLLREKDECRAALAELRKSSPDIAWSQPRWLVDRWTSSLAPDELDTLLRWNNTPPDTFARINLLRTTAANQIDRWKAEGVEAEPFSADWAEPDTLFVLRRHPPLESLPSFREGGFYIQDPSTLLAVSLLDPKPGDRVLDLCAAPGGKTAYIAQRMQNSGTIVAHDSNAERLKMVRENCDRLGISNVSCSAGGNAGTPPSELAKSSFYDRVLIDAPCSNTGVLRRRVELRWRIRPEEISRLAAVQSSLLDQVAPWIKPGGTLVYSTCSLEPEENAELVAKFLGTHPEFRETNSRALHPARDRVDGAFAVRLEKAG